MGQYSMTIAQVAEEYQLSDRTIRKYLTDGRLRGVRVGPRAIRLDPDEVRQALIAPRNATHVVA